MNNSSILHQGTYCSLKELQMLTIARSHQYEVFLTALIIINSLMAVLCSLINIFIIFTVARAPALTSTPSNILILGLALSDFLASAISQPLYCLQRYAELTRNVRLLCNTYLASKSSSWLSFPMTFFLLSAITADRFLAVRLHLRYNAIITAKRMKAVVAFIFILSCGLSLARLVENWRIGMMIFGIILVIILLLFDGYFFFAIWRVINRHSSQIHAQQPNVYISRCKKSVNTLYYVIAAFVLCYTPLIGELLVVAVYSEHTQSILVFRVLSLTFSYINGLINPMIYFRRNRELRNAAVQAVFAGRCIKQELM